MRLIILLTSIVICVIVQVKSERNNLCENDKTSRFPQHARVKRAKYYSYPSRFYRKPPMIYPVKGPFSYTPPPGYKDEERQYPARTSKVSTVKRPYDGLDDEDINNIVKYLSKKDLEKIIESASGKNTNNREYSVALDASGPTYNKPEFIFKETLQEIDDDSRFLLNSLNTNQAKQPRLIYANTQSNAYLNDAAIHSTRQNIDELRHNNNIVYVNREQNTFPNYAVAPNNLQIQPSLETFNQNYNQKDQLYPGPYQNIHNTQFQAEESKKSFQLAYVTPHNPSFQEIAKDGNIFTDSRIMQEETLPKPVNLREDDYEAAYSNKAPTVVKSSSYQLENFGDLPLMNYHNSKLHSVSSYNVPHYTVTSNAKSNSPPIQSSQSTRTSVPFVEPAPPKSAAKEQSDAHLKAVKIWTHRSRGTAYTLHNDGTLTLEKPNRPKTTYGVS